MTNEPTLSKQIIVELMSGSKLRLPFHTRVTIDDPAELVALLALPDGCFFHTHASKKNIPTGLVVPVLNVKGPMTIPAAKELIDKDYIPYLLWESTKVPGELQHVRRIEVTPVPTLITSDEESIQGWSYISIPNYTLERMKGESNGL